MVRMKTMAVVIPAAIMTASRSYSMVTMPRVTLSAMVKIARRMKLIGKLLIGKSFQMIRAILILHSEGPDAHHREDHQQGHPQPCPHQPHVISDKFPEKNKEKYQILCMCMYVVCVSMYVYIFLYFLLHCCEY